MAGANPALCATVLLHDALRDFALEAAALLTDDLRAGAEVEFDVIDEARGAAPRCTATSRAPRPSWRSAGSACASCPPARAAAASSAPAPRSGCA